VIVQDIGVFAFIKEKFPELELHVSTQMTVTGQYGAALLKEMGACRIVPARELSLAEIIEMKETTGLEIETFIHGAMCYCYSGQCLFSSILGGRSGNRGRCAQPCRLPYQVKSNCQTSKECYPLSLKDMCTIEHIPELIEAGIDSFKIEGRMKKPEYAAGVTAIYRKYIDHYYDAPQKPFQVSDEDLQILSRLYIRSERQDGYYYKHNGKDMVTLTQPSYSGSDEALLTHIRSTYLEHAPKWKLAIYGVFQVGESASVTIMSEGLSVTVTGDIVQTAQKQPVTAKNIRQQLGKLGDTIFEAEQIDIMLDEQAFYPLKAMNELRREAVLQLEDMIIREYGLTVHRTASLMPAKAIDITCDKMVKRGKGTPSGLAISVRTLEQLQEVVAFAKVHKLSRIYLEGDLLISSKEPVLDLFEADFEGIIALPHILRKRDQVFLHKMLQIAEKHADKIKGFQVRNVEGMGYLKTNRYQGKIFTDAGFYIWNCRTLEEWSKDIAGYCIPFELKAIEQRNIIRDDITGEKIFYGRIPMMVTANCVTNTMEGCQKGTASENAALHLIDRYHKAFPVVRNCEHCMNIIYNSVPLSLHGEWSKWMSTVDMRLDFTVENRKETKLVLDYFINLFENGNAADVKKLPFDEYTTGHEKRGVE